MSTRATIILTYEVGNSVQLYHHTDGYPEYMGEMLSAFLKTVFFLPNSDSSMYNLLKAEKHFEFEKSGIRHGDIEYIWYLNLKDGTVSYTKTDPLFDKVYSIKDENEFEKEYVKLFDEILNAKNGEIKYFEV